MQGSSMSATYTCYLYSRISIPISISLRPRNGTQCPVTLHIRLDARGRSCGTMSPLTKVLSALMSIVKWQGLPSTVPLTCTTPVPVQWQFNLSGASVVLAGDVPLLPAFHRFPWFAVVTPLTYGLTGHIPNSTADTDMTNFLWTSLRLIALLSSVSMLATLPAFALNTSRFDLFWVIFYLYAPNFDCR